jgi:hypothetical protein
VGGRPCRLYCRAHIQHQRFICRRRWRILSSNRSAGQHRHDPGRRSRTPRPGRACWPAGMQAPAASGQVDQDPRPVLAVGWPIHQVGGHQLVDGLGQGGPTAWRGRRPRPCYGRRPPTTALAPGLPGACASGPHRFAGRHRPGQLLQAAPTVPAGHARTGLPAGSPTPTAATQPAATAAFRLPCRQSTATPTGRGLAPAASLVRWRVWSTDPTRWSASSAWALPQGCPGQLRTSKLVRIPLV